MKRPRIAIPEINQDVKNYTGAVYAAGMDPIVISVQAETYQNNYQQEYLDYSEFNIEGYDGLLLPGGWDINPNRYGCPDEECINIRNDLDELQFAMLEAFVKCGKPVLGICRGCQLINVYFGGTLIQHISTAFRHIWDEKHGDRVHRCVAGENCWLSELYGTQFWHNSAHHQAADRIGEGLVADSRCPEDGLIEALHHESLPIYGVQWHPERMCLSHRRSDTVDGLRVLQFFSRLCGGNPEASEELARSGLMSDGLGL